MRPILEKFLNSAISHKLMMIVMSCIFFVLCLVFVSFLAYDIFKTRQAITNELELVGESLNINIAPTMVFENQKEAQQVISEARIKKSIIVACLYSNNNTLFAEYSRESNKTVKCQAQSPVEKGFNYGFDAISLYRDVTDKTDNKVASLYIVSDTQQMKDEFIATLIGTIVSLIIASTLSYFGVLKACYYTFTRPFSSLTTAAKGVSRNDYTVRAVKYYNDECGMLADTFNTMMEQVEYKKEELDGLVQERTNDLQKSYTELQKTNEDLKLATEAKNLWITNIGHELRTPIHGILQFISYCIKESKSDTIDLPMLRGYFGRIDIAAQRLGKLIEGLLFFGRAEAGQSKLNFKEHDMFVLIKAEVDNLFPQITKNGVEVQLHEPACETTLVFDLDCIAHVVTNIVANAVKFTPQGNRIDIFVAECPVDNEYPDGISVSVKDSGVGIPVGEEEKIFEKFVQSTRTYDGTGGTGLGLSISTEMIKLHHGKIFAQNNEGEVGSTFTFILPRGLQKTEIKASATEDEEEDEYI